MTCLTSPSTMLTDSPAASRGAGPHAHTPTSRPLCSLLPRTRGQAVNVHQPLLWEAPRPLHPKRQPPPVLPAPPAADVFPGAHSTCSYRSPELTLWPYSPASRERKLLQGPHPGLVRLLTPHSRTYHGARLTEHAAPATVAE